MSVFKTTFSRALRVIPSDDCNVPSPNLLIQGDNTSVGVDPLELIDNNTNFFINVPSESTASAGTRQYRVNVGDVVYCYDTGLAATIVRVKTQNTLVLNADIFQGGTGVPYLIYQEGAQTGLGNTGAYLYIGGEPNHKNIHVTTIGGESIVITQGTQAFFPIQVKKVWLTDTELSQIFAVW
jgi:hypothetical protein